MGRAEGSAAVPVFIQKHQDLLLGNRGGLAPAKRKGFDAFWFGGSHHKSGMLLGP